MITSRMLREHKDTLTYPSLLSEVVEVQPLRTNPLPDVGIYPEEMVSIEGEFKFERPWLHVFDGGVLAGSAGVGWDHKRQLILDTAYGGRLDVLERNKPYFREAIEKLTQSKPEKLEGPVIPLVGTWSGNYFHWMLEYLPKLQLADFYWASGKEMPLVLLERNPPPFQTQTIEALGYRYIKMEHSSYEIEHLLVVSTRRDQGRTAPSVVRWLRENISTATSTELPAFSERPNMVLIDRSAAKERRILNPDALSHLVNIRFEGKTVAIQRYMMNEVTELWGPHGGGFTNMVFMRPGGEIHEFFGSYINPCFRALAAACGHKYSGYFTKGEGDDIRIPDLLLDTWT